MTQLHAPETLRDFAVRFSIASQLFGSRSDASLKRFDLTGPQFAVLNHLLRLTGRDPNSTLRISQIADAVEVHQPAVTKMIAKFERAGLVTLHVDGSDKRVKSVSISPTGIQRVIEVQKGLHPDMATWFADWSKDDLTQFVTALTRLGQHLDRHRPDRET